MKNQELNALDYAQEYYPAIVTAIEILLDEKKRRNKLREAECQISTKHYNKEINKTKTTAQIDEVVRQSFGVSKEPITAIRLHRCKRIPGNTERKKPFEGQFYPRAFEKYCKKELNYTVKNEDLELILVMTDLARPVKSVYIEDKRMILHRGTQAIANECVKFFCELYKTWPNVSYWNVILKYIRKLKLESPEFLYLLAKLPTIPKVKYDSLNHKTSKIQSSLSVEEIEKKEERFRYLHNFKNDLQRLFEIQGWDKCKSDTDLTWSKKVVLDNWYGDKADGNTDGFRNLSIGDLFFIRHHSDFIAQITCYPIRPQDVDFIFRYMTKLDDIAQDEILRLIDLDINLDLMKTRDGAMRYKVRPHPLLGIDDDDIIECTDDELADLLQCEHSELSDFFRAVIDYFEKNTKEMDFLDDTE